jgi:DNA repair protein SbcD/Mre11
VSEPGQSAGPPLRLMHSSDCHLGSDLRDDSGERGAFAALIDATLSSGAAGLLISGDLFDHHRVSDELIGWTFGQLRRLDGEVILLPGNHDHEVLGRLASSGDAAARWPGLTIITDPAGQLVRLGRSGLCLWGRAMPEHTPAFRPLQGLPARPAGDDWCVALGHGLVTGDGNPHHRAAPIYPADLTALAATGWDYVALGHVHAYRVVQDRPATPVVYCGATASSKGGAPGAVLVELSATKGVSFQWQPI